MTKNAQASSTVERSDPGGFVNTYLFVGSDRITGRDALGRAVYASGHRRADGIWVCPPCAFSPPALYKCYTMWRERRRLHLVDDWQSPGLVE